MIDKYKKILVVTNSITGGGAEDSAYKIYEELRARGMNIKLCVLNSAPLDIIPSEVIALSRAWKSGPIATYRCFKKFENVIEQVKPNILVAHCELPELFSAFLKKSKIHIICVEHTTRPWINRRFLGAIVRVILRAKRARWITVISNSPAIWLGERNPIYIPNPITKLIQNSKNSAEQGIVFIGRVRREKRPEWAIVSALENKLPIEIYGDGQELPILQKKYSKYSTLVKFKGYTLNPWNEINSANLVIVPSEFEGDGLVVVESILNGNPILLHNNKDLRRFNLPDLNYFESQENLNSKVSKWKNQKSPTFVAPVNLRTHFMNQRNLKNVANQWENLLI